MNLRQVLAMLVAACLVCVYAINADAKGKDAARAFHCNADRIICTDSLCTAPMIDLHGCTLAQSKPAVERLVTKYNHGLSEHVVVITGKGIHSRGPPVLVKKIPKFVTDELHLKCNPEPKNAGRLVIHLQWRGKPVGKPQN